MLKDLFGSRPEQTVPYSLCAVAVDLPRHKMN